MRIIRAIAIPFFVNNGNGSFDFGLVLSDAPDDALRGLANDIESIPFHRRANYFRVTMDTILGQVSPGGGSSSSTGGSIAPKLSRAQRKQHLVASLNDIKKSQLVVGEQIGRGGFGDVYAGTYKRTAVAVKMMGAALRGANQAIVSSSVVLIKN